MHYNRSRIQSALRRFLLGRVATGLLGLIFFILVLRTLDRDEFGAYAALLALQAGAAVLGTLGIESTLERFLPELRTQQDDGAVTQLILLGVIARGAVLLLIAGVAALSLDVWVPLISMQPFRSTIPLALAWLVLFGLLSTCSAIHEALLNQGTAQLAQATYSSIKTVLFLFLPIGLVADGGLHRVILCELIATALALLLALETLRHEARHVLPALGGAPAVLHTAIRRRMLRFGLKNYGAQLLMLLYGADAMRLVASSQAGLAQAGRFGAVHALYEYIQRYLPAFMLIRLIRPVFVSRYTATGDFRALNSMAAMVLKLNLLVLTPLMVFLVGCGDLVLGVMSKGRYSDAGMLLVAYVALLVPVSNQWVVSVVASTTEQNDTQLKAAAMAVPGIFIGAALIPYFGVAALVAGAWCSAVVYNVSAMFILRRAGFPINFDWRALSLCFLCISLGGILARLLNQTFSQGAVMSFSLAGAIALLCMLALFMCRLFSQDELRLVKSIIQRTTPTA